MTNCVCPETMLLPDRSSHQDFLRGDSEKSKRESTETWGEGEYDMVTGAWGTPDRRACQHRVPPSVGGRSPSWLPVLGHLVSVVTSECCPEVGDLGCIVPRRAGPLDSVDAY